MLRRTPIFTALDPGLISSGLVPDAYSIRKPLWSEAAGVVFVSGRVLNRRSDRKLLHVYDAPVRGMAQQRRSNGEKALWFVQNNLLMIWDQFSLRMLKEYAPGPADKLHYQMLSYGDWLFINRGFGNIDWWNGAAFSTLPEMPSNVVSLRKHLSFLLAFGVGDKNTGVAWSDANDISKWISSSTNTAGVLFMDEFDGGIKTAAPLGPVIAVYSENQMGLVSFVGSPFYFGQKTMLSGIGAIGPRAVAAVGSQNFGVSRQGIWTTDGSSYDYIDTGKLRQHLQTTVNWDLGHKIIANRNDILRTVEFHFPIGNGTELEQAWSFDLTTGGWSDIPAASDYSEDLVLGLPLRAESNGEIRKVGGAAFTETELYLRTKPLLMQLQSPLGLTDVHFQVKVDEVELLLHKARNCRMRIGSSQVPDVDINWSTYITLETGKQVYKVPAGVPDGTYWYLEFCSGDLLTSVVEEGEQVFDENGLEVVAVSAESTWELDFQGFMLFGAISGATDA